MKKVLIPLLAVAALIGATVPFAGAAPQSHQTITMHLLEKDLTFGYQDVGPKGIPFQKISAGDSMEFSSALLTRSGKRAGTLRAHCLFITGGNGNTASSICDGSFGFKGGSLELQTMQRGDHKVTRIAIIGGTGVYEGATGQVTSVSPGENALNRDTIHIILP